MKNVLNNFTIRSLKLNIKRTIATCMGIIMSTALICAVAGVFSSFQQTLIQHAKESDGNYHAVFFDVKPNEQKYILENRNVKSTFITQGIGYSKLEKVQNEYKPYLYLMAFDKDALNDWGLKLVEGRMPENSNEIVIPKHLESNGGVTYYHIGDKLTLNIGKRLTEDGEELKQNNSYNNSKDEGEEDYVAEHLEVTQSREFTIVGVIERPNMEIEDYSAPGYTVITLIDNVNKQLPVNIAVKYKNIRESYNITKDIEKQLTDAKYTTNSELLRWSGVTKDSGTLQMLYSLAGIVIGIIIISSVFVIRNSFAISITEKMKQYGMLSSIGATKKQIKKNVLFEGMLLGLISIPIGILCGVLATFILMRVSTELVGKSVFTNEVEFVFSMPYWAVIISIALGFVTIYLSCIFSARRAAKISPIDAIRSNTDIKIKSKKIKCPKLVSKIFGIGGEIAYKNLKRNKKKYRTTVISLVVSITVFISLSTFLNYAFGMTGIYYKEMDYNITIYSSYSNYQKNDENSAKNTYEYYQKLMENSNVDKYAIMRTLSLDKCNIEQFATEEFKKYYKESYSASIDEAMTISITSIGNEAYREYVKKIGGKYDDYKDSIIYCDDSSIYTYDNESQKSERMIPFNFKENDVVKGITVGNEEVNLKIAKISDQSPLDANRYTFSGTFLVSDEFMDKLKDYGCYSAYVNASNAEEFCKKLDEEETRLAKEGIKLNYTNYKEEAEQQNKMVLLISIFLYGFIIVITLIGVTNIFNTITTNMNLRSKEFAMLKSIGMTKKEFDKMINLESIFYGVKSLIIGVALGSGISYWIYKISIGSQATENLKFVYPTKAVIISVIFIVVIVGIIMRYSLNKINKQNIIETIRNDNI